MEPALHREASNYSELCNIENDRSPAHKHIDLIDNHQTRSCLVFASGRAKQIMTRDKKKAMVQKGGVGQFIDNRKALSDLVVPIANARQTQTRPLCQLKGRLLRL